MNFAYLINVFVSLVLISREVHVLPLQELQIPSHFNMCLVINKCITVLILKNLSCRYLRNHSASDVGIFGCVSVVSPKECFPEEWQSY